MCTVIDVLNSILITCTFIIIFYDAIIFTGICTTNDVDALLYHMNNARYLRELDFARVDFYERTDLYREICSQGSGVVQGAATIRYRRFIKPLTIFKITSKVINSRQLMRMCRMNEHFFRDQEEKSLLT